MKYQWLIYAMEHEICYTQHIRELFLFDTKYRLIKLLSVFSSNHSLVKFSKPTGNKATGSTSKIRHLLPNLRLNYFRHKFS